MNMANKDLDVLIRELSAQINDISRKHATIIELADKELAEAKQAVVEAENNYKIVLARNEALKAQAKGLHEQYPEALTKRYRTKAEPVAEKPKRGRKIKVAKAVKEAKPEKAPKEKKVYKKASEGKLTMIERVIMVMGSKAMDTAGVAEGLKAKGIAPKSNNLNAYISQTFSTGFKQGIFEKEGRGFYRVVESKKNGKADSTKASKRMKAAKEITQESTANADVSADAIFNEVGLPPGAFNENP
jgi:hypothetical protein